MWTLVSSPVDVPCIEFYFIQFFKNLIPTCSGSFITAPVILCISRTFVPPFPIILPTWRLGVRCKHDGWSFSSPDLGWRNQYLDSEADVLAAGGESFLPQFLEYQVLSLPLSLGPAQYRHPPLVCDGGRHWASGLGAGSQTGSCRRYPSCRSCGLVAATSCLLFLLWGDLDWWTRELDNITDVASFCSWENMTIRWCPCSLNKDSPMMAPTAVLGM